MSTPGAAEPMPSHRSALARNGQWCDRQAGEDARDGVLETLGECAKGSGGNDGGEQRSLARAEQQPKAADVESVDVPVAEDGGRLSLVGIVRVSRETLQERPGAANGEHEREIVQVTTASI